MYLVLNRAIPGKEEETIKKIDEIGLDLIGTVYEDETVAEYDIEGKPLMDLPDDSASVTAVSEIVSKILDLRV